MECLCGSLICKWIISIFRSRVCVDFIPHNSHVARHVAATWEKTKAKQSRKYESESTWEGKKKEERATKSLKSRRVTISMLFPFFFCNSSFNLHSSSFVWCLSVLLLLCFSWAAPRNCEMRRRRRRLPSPHHNTLTSSYRFSHFPPPFFSPPPLPTSPPPPSYSIHPENKKATTTTKNVQWNTTSRHSKWKNFSLCDFFFFRVFLFLKDKKKTQERRREKVNSIKI